MQKIEFLKNWIGKTISVVIDYKNPSGFDDNIKGILTEVGDDFIVIVPEVGFCEANLIRWDYIKSIRLYGGKTHPKT